MTDSLEPLSDANADLAKESIALLHQYQQLQDRYTALLKLNQLTSDCADLSKLFTQVHRAIAAVMSADNFYIVLYDQTLSTLDLVYHVDEKDHMALGVYPLSKFAGSMTNYVIATGKALLATPEVIKSLEEANKITAVGTSGIDWLGVPLMHDGFVIGVMVVQRYSADTRYQESERDLLEFTAQHIVTAITRLQDRKRLQAAVDARTRELMQQIRDREKSELLQESLYRISELTNDPDLVIDTFYRQVHNIIGQLINAENFYIAKYNASNDELDFAYVQDQKGVNSHQFFKKRKLSNRFTELVIRSGETVLLSQQDMLALHEQGKTIKPEPEVESWLGVPLIDSGELVGAMVLQSYHSATRFTEQDAELLRFVSRHVASAMQRREVADYKRKAHELLEHQVKLRTAALEDEIKQRKIAEEKLQHAACHDILTGLPNRAVFIDLLNHAIARSKRRPSFKFAVLFLDLDRFKVVNDSLGHHAGDMLLKEIAIALMQVIRDTDTVARLGGDEFVILVEDLESDEVAHEIASRITELLSAPFYIDNQSIFIGTSIGVLFNNARYTSADNMLRDADTAMYHAKDKGKGCYEVFDASMHKKVQNALSLEADIRTAIAEQEFVPYFQPIISMTSGKVVGFEALARWHNEQRGFVLPSEFIPLAEETNLVMAIDLQILEKSCQQLKAWQQRFGYQHLYVSCNFYCNHFFSLSLPQDIQAIIDKTGVSPQQVRVEITERALLENSDVVLKNMHALKKMGVKILLDDFGTGYSSLSYLHRFPMDVLKIDRSFIESVHDRDNHQAIIKTIIDLASNLQMETVAEGIENLADAQLLEAMGCMYAQGFYYFKPLPSKEVAEILASNV
ncbi:diguanylate cyclase/phosphodiesterase with GAF sensor [Colwellia chukchiensis]|uniref:Diguanylate cyclase/phosphodiesterase with GAF sensor n=1 Tax=Colwellia chukchiensis TaxID=641665 RepID=A0A1H7L8I0_9GAMM|nr:EAL domain-containing protein [Colwellia chukchiensis]SEK95164.1 diguanylate cyclase/phosphodiesterase with GAF sensor [Colwellia chukchiensis]